MSVLIVGQSPGSLSARASGSVLFNLLTRRRWVHTLTSVRLHGVNRAGQDIEILTNLRIPFSLDMVYQK